MGRASPVARWFFKDFRPGSRDARDASRSPDAATVIVPWPLVCGAPHAAGTDGPHVLLGRAARLIEGPHTRLPSLGEMTGERCMWNQTRERSTERKRNDYPERWITWLVGR